MERIKRRYIVLFALLCLAAMAGLALASSGGPYELSWFTLESGGVVSAGGSYSLVGVIGQPDACATEATGGTWSLYGGFLVPFRILPGARVTPDAWMLYE